MKPKVFILVTCRNPELIRASILVFETIRIGFPDARIVVDGNALPAAELPIVREAAEKCGVVLGLNSPTRHADWIRAKILAQNEPFWIVDTDVIFWQPVNDQAFDGFMHGRLIPMFQCPFTRAITHRRLHTAVMKIDPREFQDYQAAFEGLLNRQNPFCGVPDLVAPNQYVLNGTIYYHDTLSQAFHAFGGTPFPPAMLDCYDHISCGTYLDLLEMEIPGSRARQEKYLEFPQTARGLWKAQETWYQKRRVA